MKRVNLNNYHRRTIKNDPIEYPYIVVVIDMQPLFRASNNSQTLEACKGLIQQAIKDSAYIIIAQYMRNGRTHQRIS